MKHLLSTLLLSAAALTTNTVFAAAIVNSAGAMGAATTITFDTATSNTIAGVQANFGVTIHSLSAGANPFISNVGGPGIGSLPNNAFGNNRSGIFSDLSDSPVFALGAFRQFEIVLNTPVTGIGFSVQGWGNTTTSHTVEAFSALNASLGLFTFNSLGLVQNDSAGNGFFGILDPLGVQRLVITPGTPADFVAFDNLTVGAPVSSVPVPSTLALLAGALGLFGLGRFATRSNREELV
jgi:hypothetical protein